MSSTVDPVEQEDADYEGLIPPENFAMIEKGLYRSGFPKKENFAFLKKSLQLKSILTLVLEDYPLANSEFNRMHGIKLLQFGVPGNKEPFVDISENGIVAALKEVLDRRNHPMLIHCNKGKHRTGCLVGSLRKVQRWAFRSIFDEYIRFSAPKPRMMDQQFIELFKTERVTEKRTVWRSICRTGLVYRLLPLETVDPDYWLHTSAHGQNANASLYTRSD